MDGILNVGDVDLIARGLLAVHLEVDVGLAEGVKNSEVLDSLHLLHRVHDLIGFFLENFQIVAIDLRGKFAFHAADGFFHVVFDGLRKSPVTPGIFSSSRFMAAIRSVLILMEDGPPLFLGFQVHEVFRVEEAGRIRSVIRTPHLAGALRHFGKRTQQYAGLIREPDPFARPGAGGKSAAHPERTFIQVRQELGANHAAKRHIQGDTQSEYSDAHGNVAMLDRPSHGLAISRSSRASITGLRHSCAPFAKKHAGKHRGDEHRKYQRPEKRKRHGPGHGPEQAPFHSLQGKDGQSTR